MEGAWAACPTPSGGGASTVPSGVRTLVLVHSVLGYCLAFTSWSKMLRGLPPAVWVLRVHPWGGGR